MRTLLDALSSPAKVASTHIAPCAADTELSEVLRKDVCDVASISQVLAHRGDGLVAVAADEGSVVEVGEVDVCELEADMRCGLGLQLDVSEEDSDYQVMLALCAGEHPHTGRPHAREVADPALPPPLPPPTSAVRGGGGGGGAEGIPSVQLTGGKERDKKDKWAVFGGSMTLPRVMLPPTDSLCIQRRAAGVIVRFMKVSHTRLALGRLRGVFSLGSASDMLPPAPPPLSHNAGLLTASKEEEEEACTSKDDVEQEEERQEQEETETETETETERDDNNTQQEREKKTAQEWGGGMWGKLVGRFVGTGATVVFEGRYVARSMRHLQHDPLLLAAADGASSMRHDPLLRSQRYRMIQHQMLGCGEGGQELRRGLVDMNGPTLLVDEVFDALSVRHMRLILVVHDSSRP